MKNTHVYEDNGARDIKHECAIFLAYRRPDSDSVNKSVLKYVLNGLKIQSNRGQEGFGLATVGNSLESHFKLFRSAESVTELEKLDETTFTEMFAEYKSNPIIGHNRYVTHGEISEHNSQPMQNGKIGTDNVADNKVLAFNGHIANADELREELRSDGWNTKGDTDTEVLLLLLTKISEDVAADGKVPDYKAIFTQLDGKIDGACSMVLLDGSGDAILYRHSNGIRPLELFETSDGVILAASETEAFSGLDGQHRTINAGEIFHYSSRNDSWSVCRVGKASPKYCILELLYFGRANSQYKGISHYRIRRSLGRIMAEEIRDRINNLSNYEKSNIRVIPVPNTAIPFAIGIANALDLPYEMGIERRENIRAFINSSNERRSEILKRKFSILKEAVEGKVVMIVDDTLIRNDTSKTITKMMREAGASRVEWLICAPPFRGTCYYGIAVPTAEELAFWVAAKRLPKRIQNKAIKGEHVSEIEKEIARDIGMDSLTFLRYEQLLKALPGDPEHYCQGCFKSIYPTPMGTKNFAEKRNSFLNISQSEVNLM